MFSCFNLVNFLIAWVCVSVNMKNWAILLAICSYVSNGGLLVMTKILRSLLSFRPVPFYSFWKGKNFLIYTSVHCWAWFSFPPFIFLKLSWSFSILLRYCCFGRITLFFYTKLSLHLGFLQSYWVLLSFVRQVCWKNTSWLPL